MRTYEQNLAAAGEIRRSWSAVIDGECRAAQNGATFTRISPRDGTLIGEVALCSSNDVDAAVRAARGSFESGVWSSQHPRARKAKLLELTRLITEHADELALIESWDMGKPIRHSLGVDVRVTIQTFEFFAEAIDKQYGEIGPTDASNISMVTREPLGVIGAIVPWNFPLMLAAWKVAPALAMGNSVVLKPAEQSPMTAIRLGELALEAGIPPGVLNVVPGDGPTTGAAIANHMDIDAVRFTGSGETGRRILAASANSNIKQVGLELGGKSPQLVCADATDDAVIAEQVVDGIFHNQGEVCSAGSRLVVHEDRRAGLVNAIVERANKIVVGDPLDPAVEFGALVERAHLEKVAGFVDRARADGGDVVLGGSAVNEDSGGCFYGPTVVDGVRPDAELAQEEVFGPVLAVTGFSSLDDGIRIANGTPYGLAASVWCENLSTAHRVAAQLRAGTVWINCYDASDVTVPFGGVGMSGFGRDKSLHALDEYGYLKTTWIRV